MYNIIQCLKKDCFISVRIPKSTNYIHVYTYFEFILLIVVCPNAWVLPSEIKNEAINMSQTH